MLCRDDIELRDLGFRGSRAGWAEAGGAGQERWYDEILYDMQGVLTSMPHLS
jgi:hypothetical protein